MKNGFLQLLSFVNKLLKSSTNVPEKGLPYCPSYTGGIGCLNALNTTYKAPTWRLWGEETFDDAIYKVYLKKVRYHHPSKTFTQESDDDEISHLEWETVRVRFLKAGTLNKLISSLTSDSGEVESSFVNVFLATYRTFATTTQILNLMLDRYVDLENSPSSCHDVPEDLVENHKKAIRLTLQVWLDSYLEDFKDPPLYSALHQIQDFAKSYLPSSEFHVKVNYKLEKLKKEDEMKNSPLLERIVSMEDLRITCSSPVKNGEVSFSIEPPYEFHTIPDEQFAAQLTRMDAELFQKVLPHQCLGSVWSQRDKANVSPTVTGTVDQFNAVSYRVQSIVLLDTDLKSSHRAKLISKWIDIAQELRLLKNFSSLKAIISGLQSNPIYRLKKTWNYVAKDKMEQYEELSLIFSEDNNQLNQRELLMKEGTAKHAESTNANNRQLHKAIEKYYNNPLAVNHGTIPYLGTFLTDLTMMDQAIPNTIYSGLINFDKKKKEFEVLAQIRLLQKASNAYRFEKDDKFDRWWDSILVLDGKEVFSLSCQIESEDSSTPSSIKNSRNNKGCGHCKNNSIGDNSIVSSNDSFIISSQNDSCSTERKMSTSSNSSLQSVSFSMHSSAASQSPSIQEKTPHSLNNNIDLSKQVLSSPYINQDCYIIKVSIESDAHEVQGVNLYKSIYLTNSEKTNSVIEKAMQKHDIVGDPNDYTLTQILPDGEMVLPPSVNVYYAVKPNKDLNFILRRKKLGDHNTVLRKNPTKDHKVRKKLYGLPLRA